MEVGGFLTWPAVHDDCCGLRHKSMGLGAGYGMCCGKQEAEGSSMDVLTFPHSILCVQITVNYFIYLHTYSCREKYVGKTCYWGKKKKPNKIDSAFRTEHDQVRGCPGIVHRIKHSPQCLNALQQAAMSDTTEKKCWTHRNWSPHLWEHINPNTSISHDENYRRSGIYLFA